MESRHHISHISRRDSSDFQNQVFESTNPFQMPSKQAADISSIEAKPGKRPRILKPLYSARLS